MSEPEPVDLSELIAKDGCWHHVVIVSVDGKTVVYIDGRRQ